MGDSAHHYLLAGRQRFQGHRPRRSTLPPPQGDGEIFRARPRCNDRWTGVGHRQLRTSNQLPARLLTANSTIGSLLLQYHRRALRNLIAEAVGGQGVSLFESKTASFQTNAQLAPAGKAAQPANRPSDGLCFAAQGGGPALGRIGRAWPEKQEESLDEFHWGACGMVENLPADIRDGTTVSVLPGRSADIFVIRGPPGWRHELPLRDDTISGFESSSGRTPVHWGPCEPTGAPGSRPAG